MVYFLMDWFLFVECDNNIVKFTFTNKYKRVYREYTYNPCDIEFEEFETDLINVIETDLINVMNLNVAIRDFIYIVCDIRSSVYDFIVKDMSRLLSRVKAILDLDSYNITMQIINNKDQEISYTL
jgi:hypothetical protein